MKTKLLILIIILQVVVNCSKNDDEKNTTCEDYLPAITTTGANTFGCCINGNLLIPRDGTGGIGGSDSGFNTWGHPSGNNEYFEIDVKDYKSEKTANILIHIKDLHLNNNNDYQINESNGNRGIDGLNNTYLHCRVFNSTTNSYQYYRSFENSGLIKIIRYDFNNRIVSGKFSCTVKNSSNPDDIIEIKEGRFDINTFTLINTIFP